MAANRWRLDVARIEQNLDAVLATLKPESLQVYSFLRARFAEGDIADDGLFQFLFRSFYRLDNAGLSDDFKQDFFRLMQQKRHDGAEFDIAATCMELYNHERLKGGPSLQFSFVTKMANTICENLPIFDSEVAAMHRFRTPTHIKDAEERLGKLMDFYSVMRHGYHTGLSAGTYQNLLQGFDQRFPDHLTMPSMKKMDFIVWSAGKVLR